GCVFVYLVVQKRTQIIENLMNQWNIAEETLVSLEDNIQKELFAQQQRVDSSAPDNKGIVKPKPRTIFEEKKETLIPTSVDRFGSGWGSVDPESLIGKLVSVRMPGEDRFEEFTIQIYDAQQEMHRLEPVYVESDAMKIDEMLNWVDLREIHQEEKKNTILGFLSSLGSLQCRTRKIKPQILHPVSLFNTF
ncbi:hypothetical protein EUTSA_v10006494mg, partial [Eutrema salsugineum]